jgi:hypothetical protein
MVNLPQGRGKANGMFRVFDPQITQIDWKQEKVERKKSALIPEICGRLK